MAELAFPLINGHAASWADIGLQVGGVNLPASVALRGFKAINYKTTVERTPIYGSGREVIGWTRGTVSHESSVTWIWETYDELIQQLGEGFMDKGMVLTVSFRLGTNVIRTVQITVAGMRETGGDFSQGSDGLESPMPFDTTRILYDGKSPVETTIL
ncbi:hypothetical protein [Sorangium sp. So ce1024]|uniref:hypothetical protein n=1 Tax=Sorangium sp. So ce1024 TaxID=3133327 RepID=UPI003F0D0B8E